MTTAGGRSQQAPVGPPRPTVEDAPPGEFYKLIVESVRDYAIFALDPLGRVRTWTRGAETLKGYRAEEIIGEHFSRFYGNDDIARGKPGHELRVASEYGRFEDEGWRYRKDGSRFWANVIITAMRDPETQALLGFSKVTRDLTERRQSEEALRQSEERFRLLVEAVQDYAIFLLDPDGRVQSWNAGAQRLKGYEPREIVGEHFRIFYPPEEAAARKPEAELAEAFRAGSVEDEGWRVRKDGTRFWANVVVTSLYDPRTGRHIGYGKVTRDLTDRRRNEVELREAYRDLEAFSYTVSHDLRAPLRAIMTLADVSLEAEVEPDVRTNLASMRESARRGAALIEDIMRFSRAAAGEFQTEEVDLGSLAEEIVKEQAAANGRLVDVRVERSPEMIVVGDPALLRVALENLISNAWKFSARAAQPRIEVASRAGNGGTAFVVRDNGIGFDPARAKAVFEPFRRLNTEYDGTGIGLATVARIVTRHGGRVWAEAETGKGASFYFTLS